MANRGGAYVAYLIMVIMGDCRAKVLSREVGEYTGIYVLLESPS